MKRHDVILNMINDFFIFWSDHCDYFDASIHENQNEINVDFNALRVRHQTNVKSQINFEKTSSISSSINIIKRRTFSSSSIENEKKEKIKNNSKIIRKWKKKWKKKKWFEFRKLNKANELRKMRYRKIFSRYLIWFLLTSLFTICFRSKKM